MKEPLIIKSKGIYLAWHKRPDGRGHRFRVNKRARSLYVQILRFELVVWY